MFYSITGDVVMRDASSVAISCGGVAFHCYTSKTTLSQIQDQHTVTLYTHLSVKEDALEIYGFYDMNELECFRLLISVTGVGPKAAMQILSVLTPEGLVMAVSSGNTKSITQAQGVGAKLAQRIALELKDKMGMISLSQSASEDISAAEVVLSGENTAEAAEALTMLGYSRSEANRAVRRLDPGLSVEKLITEGLKLLSGR